MNEFDAVRSGYSRINEGIAERLERLEKWAKDNAKEVYDLISSKKATFSEDSAALTDLYMSALKLAKEAGFVAEETTVFRAFPFPRPVNEDLETDLDRLDQWAMNHSGNVSAILNDALTNAGVQYWGDLIESNMSGAAQLYDTALEIAKREGYQENFRPDSIPESKAYETVLTKTPLMVDEVEQKQEASTDRWLGKMEEFYKKK